MSDHRALSRRAWLAKGLQAAVLWPVGHAIGRAPRLLSEFVPGQSTSGNLLAPEDDRFLEELEKATFQFFWLEADPANGQVKDRSLAAGTDPRNVSSIAATGFGLTALCIAHRRGWLDPAQISERVKATLRFSLNRLPHVHGFFYHFVNMHTGQRVLQCEVSPMDTALFLCGALACRAYFPDEEIRALASRLYERIDWTWMLQGQSTLATGWTPEGGFFQSRWDTYSELMMIYLLGIGSPSHPLPPETWNAWARPAFQFDQYKFIGSFAPLFVHQYSHAWFDFRAKHDKHADYFENSVVATKAHRQWCLELRRRFPDYSENLWGITASDSVHGYVVWGGPPQMGPIDGTVVPCAAGGSLAFLAHESLQVLKNMRNSYRDSAWGRYGFADAFNPLTGWFGADVVGIDAGITLLMAENLRTAFVWEQFMKNPEARRAMDLAGFQSN